MNSAQFIGMYSLEDLFFCNSQDTARLDFCFVWLFGLSLQKHSKGNTMVYCHLETLNYKPMFGKQETQQLWDTEAEERRRLSV